MREENKNQEIDCVYERNENNEKGGKTNVDRVIIQI